MGKDSGIEWTHHTFNPWWGCVKVSPACAHCYAEAWDKRMGGTHWGPDSQRKVSSNKYWNEPLKWNDAASKVGERHRVFCASMADVFEDRADLNEHRARLWELIEHTPNLDWLLLTKRPENIKGMLPKGPWQQQPKNIWLGTTAEDQEWANKRVPYLIQNDAAVHFISYEPALGSLVLKEEWFDVPNGINWVICGGESGAGSRPMNPAHACAIRDQCVKEDIAFHFKQWGDHCSPEQLPEETFVEWDKADNAAGNPDHYNWRMRWGKKRTGRLLDGRTWDEYPQAVAQ